MQSKTEMKFVNNFDIDSPKFVKFTKSKLPKIKRKIKTLRSKRKGLNKYDSERPSK